MAPNRGELLLCNGLLSAAISMSMNCNAHQLKALPGHKKLVLLDLIDIIEHHGTSFSFSELYSLIQVCSHKKDLAAARVLCAYITKCGFHPDSFLSTHLIHMFCFCGSLSEAAAIFQQLQQPSIYAWSAIISAFSKYGSYEEAILHYNKMSHFAAEPDGHVFVATVNACANLPDPISGRLVHAHVIDRSLEKNKVVGNSLVDMYFKCGCIEDASTIFSKMQRRDVVTWNSFIAGLVQYGCCKQAANLVGHMLSEKVHPNTVTWNTIISGYSQSGDTDMVLMVFSNMQQTCGKPDLFTFATALKACASKGALNEGKWIHGQLIESGMNLDLHVSNALLDMYIKCGRVDDAHREMSSLTVRDVVTWTTIITGYAQLGDISNAELVLKEMLQEDKIPDRLTFVSLLKACINASAIYQGKLFHSYVLESELESDVYIRNTLIDLYAKCADFTCAYALLDNFFERDIIAWGAFIGGLCVHGRYSLALECVHGMFQDGLKPNAIILLSLLSACSQLGMADEGEGLFLSMINAHDMTPTTTHYNLIVDLLARAGHLRRAKDILQSMPMDFSSEGWTSLLHSCRNYCNIQLGRFCFDQMRAKHKQDASIYILMYNIYLDANMLQEAETIQELLNKEALSKEVGLAHIEVGHLVHNFCVGDKSHSQSEQIYLKLVSLRFHFNIEGYVPAFI
ncbi:hypothetical protein KP509_1Z110500 [Ceratopteris richardii]|nr:hypothetical protein KP509_1Z110500 [Ceratopteris richardii]